MKGPERPENDPLTATSFLGELLPAHDLGGVVVLYTVDPVPRVGLVEVGHLAVSVELEHEPRHLRYREYAENKSWARQSKKDSLWGKGFIPCTQTDKILLYQQTKTGQLP